MDHERFDQCLVVIGWVGDKASDAGHRIFSISSHHPRQIRETEPWKTSQVDLTRIEILERSSNLPSLVGLDV